ncbi:MAG: primosomal protein N', partial [Coriobacteriales bacterium]
MTVARVIVDVKTRALAKPLDYAIPTVLESRVRVGVPVLVPLGARRVVGYVVDTAAVSDQAALRELEDVLDESLFDEAGRDLALWIAQEYAAHPIDALRLVMPPGSAPSLLRVSAQGGSTWALRKPTVKALEDRVVEVIEAGYTPPGHARLQRSVLDALRAGPVLMSELRAELGPVSAAVKALQARGVVRVTSRRHWRGLKSGPAGASGVR